MKVIVVNGQKESGKTTFECMIKNYAKEYNKKVEIISTIDYIKECATNFFGWNGIKDTKSRRFLSDLKNALARWKDIPFLKIVEKINSLEKEQTDIVFVDCREPEEIEKFVEKYNALTMIVVRGKYTVVGNYADDNVMNYEYDIEIDNSRGLKELEEEAKIFIETFLLEA